MAILRSQPRIELTIKSNGTKLTAYEDNNDKADGPLADKTAVKYIETVPDISFSIHIMVRKEDWSHNMSYHEIPNETGQIYRRAYRFKNIETIEDTSSSRIKLDKQRISEMGVIKVNVFQKKKGEIRPMSVMKNPEIKEMTIAEKATKGSGISHGLVFGETTRFSGSAPIIVSSKYKDGEDKPLAVFIFKYCSKSVLQSMGLVPRTPSPDPHDLLTPEERERKLREILARERDGKPDIKSIIKPENARVKHERGFEDGEMIDLTHPAKLIKKTQSQDSKKTFDLTDD